MTSLAKAIRIAAQAHEHYLDKAGVPYVLHPLRIMMRMDTEEERIVAVLHDVVEDSDWSLDMLRQEGFSEMVLAALEAVTKRAEEEDDYMAFVCRAGTNPIARKVKLADLEDNLDLKRIANPTQKDFDRVKKYHQAWARLRGEKLTVNPGRS